MEEIINVLEDYEGVTLYDYRVIFPSINKKQRNFLIDHFHEYAWNVGLSIAQCFVTTMPKTGLLGAFKNNVADIEFVFKSSKPYEDKDQIEWTESDLVDLLDTRLVGKEQFFSNIYYSGEDLENNKPKFFDQHGYEYDVIIDKYSSIIKVNITDKEQ